MKICILGSYAGKLDEGMANVSYNVYQNLHSMFQDVRLINVEDALKLKFWKEIFAIKPDIVHYIPGPTIKGLLLVKLVQIFTSCKSVVSATKPELPRFFWALSPFLKPDIVIVQSKKNEYFFKSIHYKCKFIPNGVDIDKFVPVSTDKKKELRREFGLGERDFIVLHIGPIKSGRNQRALLQLQQVKLLLIASITNPSEETAYNELIKANVIIWKEYYPNIQDIYALADVYVFPIFEELNSIDMPLSVLEAMSCNLPVITTRYGGLDTVFQESKGLFYINDANQISEALTKIRQGDFELDTRSKVKQLSWKNIVKQIADIYRILDEGGTF